MYYNLYTYIHPDENITNGKKFKQSRLKKSKTNDQYFGISIFKQKQNSNPNINEENKNINEKSNSQTNKEKTYNDSIFVPNNTKIDSNFIKKFEVMNLYKANLLTQSNTISKELLKKSIDNNYIKNNNINYNENNNNNFEKNSSNEKQSIKNPPIVLPSQNTLTISNDIINNPLSNEISKAQYKVLMAKNNLDPSISKLSTAKFDYLNLKSTRNTRSLGGNEYTKYSNPPFIDPSYTSGKAVLKNKFIEDFWKQKDPSKVAITPKLIDQHGYELDNIPEANASADSTDSKIYYDGSTKLYKPKKKDKAICFLPIVKKLYDPSEPLDNIKDGCEIDYMKLWKELSASRVKPKIQPTWGSMDPEDYPNPLSKDKEPINYNKNFYYVPEHEVKLNGYNMTPTVHAKNYQMAKEFAQLIKKYLGENSKDTQFNNSEPEELKRSTIKEASLIDSSTIVDPNVTTNTININSNSDVNGSINNNINNRFKLNVGIKWNKKVKNRIGNVIVQKNNKGDYYQPKINKNYNSIVKSKKDEDLSDIKLDDA